MNMRERFEDAYPPRLNGGFCKERNWYERKDDGRWYPDIERNHQWNIWQKAWQACELSLQQQNAELKEQSSRLAAEAVRQAQQNADLCVKNAELLNVIKWANNHGGLGYSIHGEFEKAIANESK